MKNRIVTARLKFSPRKAGGDMSEAQLSDWLANTLNFTDGLDVDTVLDGDPLSALTGKGVVRRLADAVRKPDPAAVMLAALRLALPVCEDAYHDALAVQENPTGDAVDYPAENAQATAAALAAWEAVNAAINVAEGRTTDAAKAEPAPVDFEQRRDGWLTAFIPISSAARQWSIDASPKGARWQHERWYAKRDRAPAVRYAIEAEGFTVREV